MGGSMAMAIRKYTDCEVYGWNRTRSVAEKAVADGTLHGIADEAAIADADLMIISLYPQSTVDFLLEHMPRMKKGLHHRRSGRRQAVFAGKSRTGGGRCGRTLHRRSPDGGQGIFRYAFASPELFQDASMIPCRTPPARCGQWTRWTVSLCSSASGAWCAAPQSSMDHMIAFTSQLAHVVSSAYIKSPEALRHNGYSAGSYKDLTRVAKLNEHMWTELFLRNAEPLVGEIDEIIRHLTDYRDAIAGGEEERLCALLREGRERKESIG